MKTSLRADVADRPRKMLAMQGEGLRKKVADAEAMRGLGRLVARAMEIAGITAKELADRRGLSDTSAISRWTNGTEPAPLGWLLTFADFRRGFLVSLAEWGAAGIRVNTIVEVDRAVNS